MEVSLDNLYPVTIYSSTSMYYEIDSSSRTNTSLDKVGVKRRRRLQEQKNQNEIHFFKSSPNDSLGIVSVIDVVKTDILDSLCPDKSGNNEGMLF